MQGVKSAIWDVSCRQHPSNRHHKNATYAPRAARHGTFPRARRPATRLRLSLRVSAIWLEANDRKWRKRALQFGALRRPSSSPARQGFVDLLFEQCEPRRDHLTCGSSGREPHSNAPQGFAIRDGPYVHRFTGRNACKCVSQPELVGNLLRMTFEFMHRGKVARQPLLGRWLLGSACMPCLLSSGGHVKGDGVPRALLPMNKFLAQCPAECAGGIGCVSSSYPDYANSQANTRCPRCADNNGKVSYLCHMCCDRKPNSAEQ